MRTSFLLIFNQTSQRSLCITHQIQAWQIMFLVSILPACELTGFQPSQRSQYIFTRSAFLRVMVTLALFLLLKMWHEKVLHHHMCRMRHLVLGATFQKMDKLTGIQKMITTIEKKIENRNHTKKQWSKELEMFRLQRIFWSSRGRKPQLVGQILPDPVFL